jgi:hypothetical protein
MVRESELQRMMSADTDRAATGELFLASNDHAYYMACMAEDDLLAEIVQGMLRYERECGRRDALRETAAFLARLEAIERGGFWRRMRRLIGR